jgi:hypothetical protein
MDRACCCCCSKTQKLYLHRGRLYCAPCVPVHELPPEARAWWVISLARQAVAASRARRERTGR